MGEGNRDDVAVRAVDDYTLEVKLTQPAPFFPEFIAVNNVTYSVPKHVIESTGDAWTNTENVVFSGPFLVSEYTPDSLIVMEPNPGWTRQQPNIDRVEYNIIPETATALAQYQADELDFVQGIPLGEIDLIQNDPELSDQFTTFSESRIMNLEFNASKPPFDNPKVRQAIAAAINQRALTEGPFRGVLEPATSMRPPGIPGPEIDTVSNLFDPERAQQLLAEAGYPDGEGFPEIKLQGRNQEDSRIAAEFLQGQISEVLNIPVAVEIIEYNAFIDLTERGEGDMYLHAIFYRAPDLYDLFGVIQNTVHNYGQWENEEWDDLLASAAVETDPDKRAEMYNEAEMMVIDDAALVPLWITDRPSLVKPRVQGLLDDKRGVWTFTWEYIDIEE
jgi:oligopeptide transport system substrate-binding protein